MPTLSHRPRKGVARRLIISVILFSAAITLLISAIQLYRDYQRDLSLIDARLEQIQDVNLKTLINSLWVVDVDEMKTHQSGMLRLPDMQYLEIMDNKEVLVSVGIPQKKNIVSRTYPMVQNYRGQPQNIGSLKVVATLDGVYARLIDQAIVILISNGIKTFLVAGFILYLFQTLVTRHLTRIAEFARNFNMEHPGDKLQLDRQLGEKHNEDELGTVVTAMNSMQKKLQQSFSALKENEAELKNHRDHLEEQVAERTKAIERQANIIDQIHDSVVSTDLEGNIASWNRGAEHLFGYSAKEAIGSPIAFVYPEDEHAHLLNGIIQPLMEKGEHETEVRMLRKNGEEFYAHLSLSLLRDDEGTPIGMIGYSIDITLRKQAEVEADRKSVELEYANKELESFSYSVSHDLRAPLRSINGFSQILLEDHKDRLDEDGQDLLLRVVTNTQRMSELINDLLKLSRLGRKKLTTSPVNFNNIVAEVVKSLKENDDQRDIEFRIDTLGTVLADQQLLKIVIENLLGNAWKYTSKNDKACIEIGKQNIKSEEVFFVKDNGVGFDMSSADKIFDAFQRLHKLDEFEGTGIGLLTVQRIIHRHGGRIWAEAEPNKGATFYFTLSALQASQSPTTPNPETKTPD
jgi:PAS domain S-box-containing protein